MIGTVLHVGIVLQDGVQTDPQALTNGLPLRQQVVAITLSVVILAVVLELIRKRRLREEYSVVWILTGVTLLALSIWTELLIGFQSAIGAVMSTSALFFGALIFLMMLSLQFSVRLSKLTSRNKALCQQLSLLEREFADLRDEFEAQPTQHSGPTIPRPDRVAPLATDALAQADYDQPRGSHPDADPIQPTNRPT